jgi:hypothetical protein
LDHFSPLPYPLTPSLPPHPLTIRQKEGPSFVYTTFLNLRRKRLKQSTLSLKRQNLASKQCLFFSIVGNFLELCCWNKGIQSTSGIFAEIQAL